MYIFGLIIFLILWFVFKMAFEELNGGHWFVIVVFVLVLVFLLAMCTAITQ